MGSQVAITGAIYANSAITFYSTAHGLEEGDEIEISGVSPSPFNGTYSIVSAATNSFVVAK